jgi:hypothetical protein
VAATASIVPSHQIAYGISFLSLETRGEMVASDTTVDYAIRSVTQKFVEQRWEKGCAVTLSAM